MRRKSSQRAWRTRIAWLTAVIGLVTFMAGNFGARIGFTVLPFDPHHVYAQFGGAAVAVVGVMWAISDDRR